MVLNKLLNKSSKKHRLDSANDNSPKSPLSSPEKRPPASPSAARSSLDREKRPSLSPTKATNRSSKRYDKDKKDRDSHPLNLPPELRRLSALSAMSANSDSTHDQQASSPATQSSAPTSPSTIYVNSPFAPDDRPPVPPHRVPTSPPPTSPSPGSNMAPANAEAFKVAGNNFFKSQNYAKAAEEYSKGGQDPRPL